MKKQISTLCIASLFCLPFRAAAAPYAGAAYEPFDYGTAVDAANTAGDSNLNLNSGGTGWNAVGDPALPNETVWGGGVTTAPLVVTNTTVTTGSLTGLLPAVGHRLQVSAGTAGRSLGQTVDSGTLYLSYTVQRLTDSIRTTNFALFNGTSERFGFGQYATATAGATSDGNLAAVFLNVNPGNLVVGSGGATQIPMGTGVPHVVIIRIDFDANGANERVRVYVDPADVSDESALLPYVDNDGFDLVAVTTVRPFSGGATTTGVILAASSVAYDDIRVGTTFASVTTPIVPPLAIAAENGGVTLSWPASYSWCFLQETASPALGWNPAPGVLTEGATKRLTLPAPLDRKFFRLANP